MQDIIRDQQDEARRYEETALEEFRKAIEKATYYVDGERVEIKNGDAKSRIDQALEYLVIRNSLKSFPTSLYRDIWIINFMFKHDNCHVEILQMSYHSFLGEVYYLIH